MSTAAIGAGGSTVGYPSRLRSINLRPVIEEPSSNTEPGSNSSNDGSSASTTSEREPASRRNENASQQSSDSGSLSPSTFNPSSRFTLIAGQSPPSAPAEEGQSDQGEASAENGTPTESATPNESTNPSELSPAERRKVQELKRIDSKVRAHEQAHLAAAGQFAQGGISFETVRGPDGNEYAVAGEVSLDTSEAETPEQTIEKMRQVKSAALAPASPSPQDRQIATQAAQKMTEARREQQSQDGESEAEFGESLSPSDNTSSSDRSGTSTGFEGPEDFGARETAGPSTEQRSTPSAAASNGDAPASNNSSVDQFITNASDAAGSARNGSRLNLLA